MPLNIFDPIRNWNGFYCRPVGREPGFTVTARNEIRIVANTGNDRNLLLADMAAPDVMKLALAINLCKLACGGHAGGSFVINEFGIVIVPCSTAGLKVVGRWNGPLPFRDENGRDCCLDKEMTPGDPWPYPYLGMRYRLSSGNRIYRILYDGDDEHLEYLPCRYRRLIDNLRAIRPYGTMTFLVNPFGAVLAKKKEDDPEDSARYAGKLDYEHWFPDPLLMIPLLSPDETMTVMQALNQVRNRMTPAEAKIFSHLHEIYSRREQLDSPADQRILLRLKNLFLPDP